MKDNCLDIGIIQAFLDGELDHSEVARVSKHIAVCDGCTVMLADAENESALVFSALERELDTLVPTQRLWYKINDSIAEEKVNRPVWEKAWAFVRVALLNPTLAAAAGLLIVVGIAALLYIDRSPATGEFAVATNQPVPVTSSQPATQQVAKETSPEPRDEISIAEVRPRTVTN